MAGCGLVGRLMGGRLKLSQLPTKLKLQLKLKLSLAFSNFKSWRKSSAVILVFSGPVSKIMATLLQSMSLGQNYKMTITQLRKHIIQQ